ncbi:HWE histidine kinase domain-containing protein [Caulobacter sp. 1776]|uniref:sensor histidine kinase n=1 Tax=Caulobacter sp. 1776 TaxID=3156420 RepID=UPI00339AE44A
MIGGQSRPRDSVAPDPALAHVYITDELASRPVKPADHLREKHAVQELAMRMADQPEQVLPRFVDLAMELTGGVSAGLSLYEPDPPGPGVFRWRYLRGSLAAFEHATTPRESSPCGVTLDLNGPVLARHPERVYGWIDEAGIVVPEVLLVPLRFGGELPIGTLWIVSDKEGWFDGGHARSMTELAAFVGIALRMLHGERQLQDALEEQELLTKEMSHRVKNLFAITDGMIRGTARGAVDKADMARSLSGRLHALASAHTLVSRKLHEVGRAPRTGDIGALIAAVVAPHEHTDLALPTRFVIEGPHVPCGDHAITGVALVFHELTTNALKYGALSDEHGRVAISWTADDEILSLRWVEQGGPRVVAAPETKGFGSTLVRNTVVSQFGGALDYDWAPEGLRVDMRLPMAKVAL